jgi:hypothetical protein
MKLSTVKYFKIVCKFVQVKTVHKLNFTFQVILSFALLGTVLAAIPFRHRRGLPGVSLKDPNPTTFTNFKQQYFYPHPSWGGK